MGPMTDASPAQVAICRRYGLEPEPSGARDPDFFVPLHIEHLGEWRAETIPYLALPPGWRLQTAPNHEDVWEDCALLRQPGG